MLLVSSYEPAHGCVAARCGSGQYPQFDPCSPQSLQQLSGRASDQITQGRGFKSHLGLGFFPSLRVSQNLHNIMNKKQQGKGGGKVVGVIQLSINGGFVNCRSVSFIFATGGMAFLLLSFCYLVIDVFGWWNGAPFCYPGWYL